MSSQTISQKNAAIKSSDSLLAEIARLRAVIEVLRAEKNVLRAEKEIIRIEKQKIIDDLRAGIQEKKAKPIHLAPKPTPKASLKSSAAAPSSKPTPSIEVLEEEELKEFCLNGISYFKNHDNFCWRFDGSGNVIYAGLYISEESRIDDSVAEPMLL